MSSPFDSVDSLAAHMFGPDSDDDQCIECSPHEPAALCCSPDARNKSGCCDEDTIRKILFGSRSTSASKRSSFSVDWSNPTPKAPSAVSLDVDKLAPALALVEDALEEEESALSAQEHSNAPIDGFALNVFDDSDFNDSEDAGSDDDDQTENGEMLTNSGNNNLVVPAGSDLKLFA